MMSCWEAGTQDGSFDTGLRNTAEAMMPHPWRHKSGCCLVNTLGEQASGRREKMISVSRKDFFEVSGCTSRDVHVDSANKTEEKRSNTEQQRPTPKESKTSREVCSNAKLMRESLRHI